MFSNNAADTRQQFITCWSNYLQKKPLTALEQQIVVVILAHPEFHTALEPSAHALTRQYFPELGETNPFLHMGLHLAVREQVHTNRPFGIAEVYQTLTARGRPELDAEHALMDCLAECLWCAQREQTLPNESAYLSACQQLLTA